MTLRTYLLKRIIIGIFVLWLVATFNFVIFSLQRGDPVAYIQNYNMDPDARLALQAAYGLNQSWAVKYVKYLRNMFTFGIVYPYFGVSINLNKGQYISQAMVPKLIVTVMLLGSAMIGRIIAGLPIGIFAASKRGSKTDVAAVGGALFTWGVPSFFVQLLAILFFGRILRDYYGIKIVSTTFNPPPFTGDLQWLVGTATQLTLPVITLVLFGLGAWVLYTRNLLIDALTQDYVTTARAKGINERTVLFKHAFKSILPPISTMVTLAIPGIVTGAIITEQIFGINGIGSWYISSLQYNIADYGIAQAVIFIFSTLVILCNLTADILYGILDPRIRVGMRR
jgi:peptide/nickel transport system permease protein